MIFEVMKLLWPFLKEFFLGKEGSIGQTVKKREWKKLGMLFLMTFSVIANLFLFPKSIMLSDQVMKLQHEVKRLKDELPPAPDPDHPDNTSRDVAAPPPEPPAQPTQTASETVAGPPPFKGAAYQERLNSIMTRAQQLDHGR
jgi:hypothetical protein